MASRSVNKVLLIGNLVRDPELRFTPQNTAVVNFTVATNRTWNDQNGQQQEETEFTRCVAWGKLAEIIGQYFKKGRKVYVEGRLQTRSWETKEGEQRKSTEVVVDQAIALDSRDQANNDNRESTDSPARQANEELKIDDSVASLDNLADDIPF